MRYIIPLPIFKGSYCTLKLLLIFFLLGSGPYGLTSVRAETAEPKAKKESLSSPESSSPVTSLSILSPVAEREKVLHSLENILNSTRSLKAEFVQLDPKGNISNGYFYLLRPGKLRWEYAPPVPVIIVVNNNLLTYYDAELEQISYQSVDNTPISFIARDEIRFQSPDIRVLALNEDKESYEVILQQTGKEEEGSLVLIFTKQPLALKEMKVIDAEGNTTQIALHGVILNQVLDKKLFIVENPTLFKKRRKN